MLTIDRIKEDINPIAKKYDIKKLALFGSYANGTQTKDSDADFLVEFSASIPSIFKVMGLRQDLEKRLNIPVDVVTLPLVQPEKMIIERTVTVYEKG